MRNPLQVKPTLLCCVLGYVLHAKSFHLFLDEDVDVFSPTAEDSSHEHSPGDDLYWQNLLTEEAKLS